MISKIEVSQRVYEDVRWIEEYMGIKITNEANAVYHAGLLNDIWGVWRLTHCYKSFTKYYAKVKLIEATGSEARAEERLKFYEDEKTRFF